MSASILASAMVPLPFFMSLMVCKSMLPYSLPVIQSMSSSVSSVASVVAT